MHTARPLALTSSLPLARRESVLGLGLLCLLALVGACKKDEPAPAAATEAAAPAALGAKGPLKVAFTYVGPVGDAGWSFAHDRGRKAAAEKFGAKITTSFVENVPESADAERVFRDLVDQGNQLIFGTTFGYMEAMLKVAREFEDTRFEHATGYKTAKNLRSYDSRTYEGAYLAGIVAGSMTKTDVIGVVASIPIPEVIRNIDSFTLGAQSQKPQVTTKVVWINRWFDPPKESEAAQALINQGADVLLQNTDSSAVLQTAEKAGKLAFGWDSDMSKFGPNAHLASAVIQWAPYYEKAIGDALDGSWTTAQTWWGVKEGAIDLVSVSDKVPTAARAKVDEVKAGLKAGTFSIWKGPLTDASGKTVLEAGAVANDEFLHAIDFYVKGVEGTLPKAQ
ncbi:MAG TPA: BMP family ABC transporter substrate-binding protein [Polyangiaceae bacterium]|nr:BMP family ABC transporter substrate-binding protein [Polyangiaceae bacterium]